MPCNSFGCNVDTKADIKQNPIYLMVTAYFPRLDNRWTCAFVYETAKAIERHSNYRVIVINPNYDGYYNFNGIDVYGFKQYTKGRWLAPRFIDWLNCRRLYGIMRKARLNINAIEVVHGHMLQNAPYLSFLKTKMPFAKFLLHFHDLDPMGMMMGHNRYARRKYFKHYRQFVKDVDMLVAISNIVGEIAISSPRIEKLLHYSPLRQAKRDLEGIDRLDSLPPVYILHNGVDQTIFTPEGRKNSYSQGGFVIGCVGFFRKLKDQITLLRAVNILKGRIPSLKVKFVGYGEMENECKEYAKDNGLDVEFKYSVEHDELPDYYRSLDLFVMPSYFEGFGCVYTEAFSCGTPFIACEGQGIEDLIPDSVKGIWLAKIRDAEDLASKIMNYYINHPVQELTGPITYDELIPPFLKAIKGIHK